jgi:hypothetical protein
VLLSSDCPYTNPGGAIRVTKSIKVWQPSGPHSHSLSGTFSGLPPAVDRQRYEVLLENHLRSVVEQDPQRAQQLLNEYESEQGMYLTRTPENWPAQILASEPMQTLLTQVDRARAGTQ